MNLITEDTESSAVIISADQAAVVPEMKFDISEFDVANFTEKDFKFK